MASASQLTPQRTPQRIVAEITSLLHELNEHTVDAVVVNDDHLCDVVENGPLLRARVDALLSSAASTAARYKVCAGRGDGYLTAGQMVSDRTGADAAQVRADIRLGDWVRDFEDFATAWAQGTLLTEHVDFIRRSVDNPRTHWELKAQQQRFIEWAATLNFVDYQRACRYWALANDPDGAEPKDQTRKTFFKAQKNGDGSGTLKGWLDPLAFAAFNTAFATEDRKLFKQDQDSIDADGNAPVFATTNSERSTGRRGAHALINLVTRGAARHDGTFPAPLITVVASESVIEAALARLDEPTDAPLPISFDDIDKRCELIDGTPLHPSYLLATLGLATFRRQILTAASRTVDVSVNARCFTPWQQQALRVQARGSCQAPGCDAPFPWLQGDHWQPHSRGGLTQLSNGQMLCEPHNTAKRDRPGHQPAA